MISCPHCGKSFPDQLGNCPYCGNDPDVRPGDGTNYVQSLRINAHSLVWGVILSLITLGGYALFWQYRLMKNIRTLRGDTSSCVREMLMLSLIPFYQVYWWHKNTPVLQELLEERGVETPDRTNLYTALSVFFVPVIAILALVQRDFNRLAGGPGYVAQYVQLGPWKAWIYLSPAIVLLLIFTVWPIINTVRVAFMNGYNSMTAANPNAARFTFGIQNFQTVVRYSGFITCLKNTMLLCVITVPISTFLALLIAVCLNAIRPLRRFLQTIFFLPYVTNSIAIGMVFAAMFNIVGKTFGKRQIIITAGIVNNLLGLFGVEPIKWINVGSAYWANMFVMVVYIVWNALPFKILVLLGGLQGINKQYYEAAKVDGTSRIRTFGRITVPLLSPMLAYVIITGFIGGFKEYTSIVGIFGETMGPANDPGRLNTMVGYIYDSLPNGDTGVASAAALILFGIIFAVTMVNMYVSKKKVHY